MLIPLILFAIAAGVVAISASRGFETEASWKKAAAELGLDFYGSVWAGDARMSGIVQGARIGVDVVRRGRRRRTRVSAGASVTEGMSLASEADRTLLGILVLGPDMQTGDKYFDAVVHLRGPSVPLRALLDANTRRRVARFVMQGGTINDTVVAIERRWVRTAHELVEVVREVADTARELSERRGEPITLLALNATQDPLADVRLANLQALVEAFPVSRLVMETLRAALLDPDPRLRVMGAVALKDAAVLTALVRDAPAAVRREALHALAGARPYAEIAPVVAAALADPDAGVQAEAVAAVGAFRDASLLEAVVKLGPRAGDSLALTMARTLGLLDDPRSERPLLLLLRRDSTEVQTAALQSLGRVGSLAAVEELLPYTESGSLREAARDAIRRIQARAGDVGEGRLSLSRSAADGAVSMATPTGAVSLAKERG